MSWRKFLEPQNDNSRSKTFQQSQSLINDDNSQIQDDKNSFDISEALKGTDVIRRLQQNDKSNERSRINTDMEEVSYSISNTNVTQDIQDKSQNLSIKPKNKLSQIKQEMAQLKNELSRFPKRSQVKQLSCPREQEPQEDIFQIRKSPENNVSYYDELSFSNNRQLDHDSFITDDDIQQISNSLQEHLQKSEKKSNSLPKQGSESSSNSTTNKINKILNFTVATGSDSSKPSRINRDEHVDKQLEFIEQDLNNERKLRQQIQKQLATSDGEIFFLNTQILDLQNQLSDFRKSILTQQTEQNQRSSVDIQENKKVKGMNQFKRINSEHFDNSSSQSQYQIQKSSTSNSFIQKVTKDQTEQIFNQYINYHDIQRAKSNKIQFEESKKSQFSVLRKSRNQLLEALESILKAIGNSHTNKSEQEIIKKVKENLKDVKEIKKIFKAKVNQLRMEFLEIGHIEPLHLSFHLEQDISQDSGFSSNVSQQNNIEDRNISQQNLFLNKRDWKLQKQENLFLKQDSCQNIFQQQALTNNFTENQSQSPFHNDLTPPLNRFSQSGKESNQENLNYSPTDVNSFYDNLNETLNISKGTILNTNKINHILQSSSLIEKHNDKYFPLNKAEFKENSLNNWKGEENWDKPLQMKQQESNYDSIYSKPEDARIIYPKVTFSKPSTAKNSPYKEKAFLNSASSPPISKFNAPSPLIDNRSPQKIQEELSFRQIIPVPLDLSQKSKDLQQKLMQKKQQTGSQPSSNQILGQNYQIQNLNSQNYMITHQINTPLPSKHSLSLVEQYQQQQQNNQRKFENDFNRDQSCSPDESLLNKISHTVNTEMSGDKSFENYQIQKAATSLPTNSDDLFHRYQTFSQQNSTERRKEF